MRKRQKIDRNSAGRRVTIVILVMGMLLGSCFDEGNCLITYTDLVKISFNNLSDKKSLTLSINSISVDGLSLVDYKDKKLAAIEVPVNNRMLSTQIILNSEKGVDTLMLSYHRKVVVVTSDCGAYNYYTDLQIEETDIPDIKLISNKLLTNVITNIEIFY